MSAVDSSSPITPYDSQRCENLANSSGIGFVDAPVLGTREPAERGELVILESGPEQARPRVQPVFDAIGLGRHVGPRGVGNGAWALAARGSGRISGGGLPVSLCGHQLG
jgi:3-hydroxyisobutyrate dehydrogenase-like beta-hydroxyacid dehydrogenase